MVALPSLHAFPFFCVRPLAIGVSIDSSYRSIAQYSDTRPTTEARSSLRLQYDLITGTVQKKSRLRDLPDGLGQTSCLSMSGNQTVPNGTLKKSHK